MLVDTLPLLTMSTETVDAIETQEYTVMAAAWNNTHMSLKCGYEPEGMGRTVA